MVNFQLVMICSDLLMGSLLVISTFAFCILQKTFCPLDKICNRCIRRYTLVIDDPLTFCANSGLRISSFYLFAIPRVTGHHMILLNPVLIGNTIPLYDQELLNEIDHWY
jgi:hypothetical protein